ncbi:hypothetical protein AAF712_008704 [Marasmius tenuissimus]|uniref:Uncharacterized protein n=1 Tax=Marasmius tenuissimus TaxID=585030 RepID=A0ABR2ZU87_9AGAR
MAPRLGKRVFKIARTESVKQEEDDVSLDLEEETAQQPEEILKKDALKEVKEAFELEFLDLLRLMENLRTISPFVIADNDHGDLDNAINYTVTRAHLSTLMGVPDRETSLFYSKKKLDS